MSASRQPAGHDAKRAAASVRQRDDLRRDGVRRIRAPPSASVLNDGSEHLDGVVNDVDVTRTSSRTSGTVGLT